MRIANRQSGEAPATSMDGEERESVFKVLVDRCRSLEENQAKLTEQFHELAQEKNHALNDVADSNAPFLSNFFFSGSPYAHILNCMGHAVHVFRPSSGEIIYWNHTAETVYGWKDYEIIGQRVSEYLITEEYYELLLQQILERLTTGVPWSGQFPFKKRSGEVFMAMATKTPLYEDGELVGVITVSSDAAVFNTMDSENQRTYQSAANGQPGVQRLNFKKIQWPPRPLIAPVPQIASSVSNLASKFLHRGHTDDTFSRNTSNDADDGKLEKLRIDETKPHSRHHHGENTAVREASEKDESTTEFIRPSKLAARVLAKLQIRGNGKCRKDNGSTENNCITDTSGSNTVNNDTSHRDVTNGEDKEVNFHKFNPLLAMKRADAKVCPQRTSSAIKDCSAKSSSGDLNECCGSSIPQDPLLRFRFQFERNKLEPEAVDMVIEDEVERQQEGLQLPSSRESIGSQESSSSRENNESNSVVECEIQWEDLQLREEIGQGSYAIVYHGIWNGSDVAVKVYFGNGYTQEILQDYRKEIDIMKRLRHPNVLLFMGAVYSQERLAMVTELLPRGSLFKTLHKNNQTLDIRRRLRMALDVARGMNYLHHRNPPIVHRDLKSSNLLVDKNWTVKVGDFGLSRLKDATLLTTKSGRGTPQWMAPEVLRNEPSNEKSDVFSFGVVLWELMTQSIPWQNLNYLQVVGVVGFMDRRLDLPEGLDPHVASIIHDCWRSDPEQRPSFEELIQRMMFLVNIGNSITIRKNSES